MDPIDDVEPDGVVPWPPDRAEIYRAVGCWRGRPLGAYLWEWARTWGQRTAVVDGAIRLSYVELATKADALAVRLLDLGLRRGDAVLVQLPNCWEFVVVTLACFRAGVVPVMMLPPHREYELSSIGAHVRARALIVPDLWRGHDHGAMARRIAASLPDPAMVLVVGDTTEPDTTNLRRLIHDDGDPDARRRYLDAHAPDSGDVALFLLSGGTTGVPKLITRSHDDYEYNIRCSAQACAFGPDTVYLAVLPAGHNFPLANPGILGTLVSGGRVVMLSSPRPEAAFAAIEAERVTATSAVPAVINRWIEQAPTSGRDLSSLAFVHVGGSVLAPEVAARIGPALGCRLQQVYGMAEGLICYTPVHAPDAVALHTQGSPISPFDELRVVGADGLPVPAGQVGELLTRGPYTPPGYYRAAAQNAVSFTPDGWYRTGDLVRLTADGHVVVCGRVKDLINRAGEKVSAGEVETLMQELPQVVEVAVVAMPDPDVGERVCAVVALGPSTSLSLAEVRNALSARGLAAFKIPEHLVVLGALPHTPVGKIDKPALRRLVAGEDRS